MRVVSASGPVYSGGSFWDITIPADIDNGILSALTPVPALSTATKEKGAGTSKGWPEDSVFGIIEQVLAPQHFASNALLLCTDSAPTLVPKSPTSSPVTMDGWHSSTRRPIAAVPRAQFPALRFTSQPSRKEPAVSHSRQSRNSSKQLLDQRLGWNHAPPTSRTSAHDRCGPVLTTGGRYWEYVNERIQSHAIYREVWVVAGASLSKAELRAQLADATTPQAIQTYVLLTGLWSAAQQCGVRARVFCSP